MQGMPSPPNRASPPKKSSADFAKKLDAPAPRDPYARTGARTGETFDMADLLSHGHAFKVPPKTLPSTAAKMAILAQTEQTLPGDMRAQAGQPNPDTTIIIDRMARVIRSRNLDLLNLMDDFLKRPAFSKMPTRNRAFLDVATFRRALCYAFGDLGRRRVRGRTRAMHCRQGY